MNKLTITCPYCGEGCSRTMDLKEGEIVSWEDISPSTMCKCGKAINILPGKYKYKHGFLIRMTSMKRIESYTLWTVILIIIPILLYFLIWEDPIVGFDETGGPVRIGLYVMISLYWAATFFIHKYYSEAQQIKAKLHELKKTKEKEDKERKKLPLIGVNYEKIVVKYDSNGNCIEENHIKERIDHEGKNDEEYKFVSKYDAKGRLIEDLFYSDLEKKDLSSKTTYKYDKNDNLIEQIEKDSDDQLEFRGEFEYDENKLLKRFKRYNEDNLIRNEETYIYDELGRCVEENILYNEYNHKTFIKYDSQGKCVERIFYENYKEGRKNTFSNKTLYIYNKKGGLLEKRSIKADESIDEITYYKYDDKGRTILEAEERRYISPALITLQIIEHIDEDDS